MATDGKASAAPPGQLGPQMAGPKRAGRAAGPGGPGPAALVGPVALCVSCAAHLEDLVAVAGALSLLAPEADPPPGFEGRVLEAARARALCWSP
jgi:hypothetical protein